MTSLSRPVVLAAGGTGDYRWGGAEPRARWLIQFTVERKHLTWRGGETEGKSTRHCAYVRTRDRILGWLVLLLVGSAAKGERGCKQAGCSVC